MDLKPKGQLQHITPSLHRKAEFEQVLRGYQPSWQALEILRSTPIVAMNGLSSTGRNSIMRELVKTDAYYFLVSDTTRPPRYNDGVLEQNGREYYFRTEDHFLEDLKNGRFIEAELIHNQQVSGISVRELEVAKKQGKIGISDMEIEGVVNFARLKPDVKVIILLPPSFEEWFNRIHKRTELEPSELHRRLQTGTKIFKLALPNDKFHFIVNDDFTKTVNDVDRFAREGIHDLKAEKAARALAKTLQLQIREYLALHAPRVKLY